MKTSLGFLHQRSVCVRDFDTKFLQFSAICNQYYKRNVALI